MGQSSETFMRERSTLDKYKLVRWSGFFCLWFGVAIVGFFSLTNAGITNYLVFSSAMVVGFIGLCAFSRLSSKAEALEMRSSSVDPGTMRVAIAAPVLLVVAFLSLLALQLS